MSHLIFDRRDWRFLMHDVFDYQALLSIPRYADFDMDTFDAVVEEGLKFIVDRVAPLNPIGDQEGCHLEGGRVRTPSAYEAVWHAWRENGYVGASRDPEWGGMGLPYAVLAPVGEALTAGCQAFAMYSGLTAGAAHLIETFGSDELKQRFVPKMYAGEWGGTMCLTEPQAGSAVGDLLTSATPIEDQPGAYHIEGGKIFISGGDATFYGNVVHLVLARVKGDPEGTKGISLFAVPRQMVDEDGNVGAFNHVSVVKLEEKLGIHGSATCQIAFGGEQPSVGYLVGEERQGLPYMFQMMNGARLECGLQGIGLANAAYQQALAYARDRKQGPDLAGSSPKSVEIINHPDVRRNLMLMKATSEGLRALFAWTARMADFAEHSADEAERNRADDLLGLLTPIVKAYSTDKGFRVTETAVQVFGGYGYTREYPVEQYLRDCKIASIYEGTNGIQALDLLGRKMRLKGGQLFMTYVMELGQFVEAHRETDGVKEAVALLEKAQGILGEVAFWISSHARQNVSLAMLQATPFLELFGDIVVSHVLTRVAAVAAEKLEERIGTVHPTREQREADAEVAFLAGKIDSARFFAREVLTLAPAKAKVITSGEAAALDMVF